MARPTFSNIESALEAWDATLNNDIDILKDGPWPIYEHTGDESDIQSTFPAASFDRCVVWINHTVLGWVLYASDGSTWAQLHQGVAVPDATAWADSTAEGEFNDLLTSLRDAGIIAT